MMTDQQRRLFVAVYLRKSPAAKDAIEASIDQQRREVRAYAKERGWVIVAEYEDGGRSGSKDQDRRTEFLRMIADSKAGKWSAVLVWHTNRFARLDIIDIGRFVGALRDNGVHLESVKQGTIDPTTKHGRMALFMYSEGDSDHSVNISGDSLRGRMRVIEDGFWPFGRVPWGYDRQLIDPQGVAHQIVPRKQKSQKPLKWHVRLVPNAAGAKTIRWMFEQYDRKDVSLRQLAKATSDRGIEAPDGGTVWPINSVRGVLVNPAYAGDVAIGGVHRTGGRKGKFNRATKTVKHSPLACPPIVPRELWERVQAKMEQRKGTRLRPTSRAGALSGILICGGCGHSMYRKRNAKGRVFYVCLSKMLRPGLRCPHARAFEDFLLPDISRTLAEAVDWTLLREHQARYEPKDERQIERLRRQLAALDAKLAKANNNLMLADPELFPALQKMTLDLKGERDKALNTLTLAEQSGSDDQTEVARLTEWAERVKGTLIPVANGVPLVIPGDAQGRHSVNLERLDAACPIMAGPDDYRALLKRLGCTVTIWFTPNGSRHYSIERGELRADFGSAVIGANTSIRAHNGSGVVERTIHFRSAA